jgi:hypothetical protein
LGKKRKKLLRKTEKRLPFIFNENKLQQRMEDKVNVYPIWEEKKKVNVS